MSQDKPRDPMDLLKEQNTNAMEWAKSFCQKLRDNPYMVIDESLMVGWFANPIMCMHDMLYNAKINTLEEKLRVAVEKQAITEKYLRMAVQYLKEGKIKFAPNTTNSFVDDFIAKHDDKIKGGSE